MTVRTHRADAGSHAIPGMSGCFSRVGHGRETKPTTQVHEVVGAFKSEVEFWPWVPPTNHKSTSSSGQACLNQHLWPWHGSGVISWWTISGGITRLAQMAPARCPAMRENLALPEL